MIEKIVVTEGGVHHTKNGYVHNDDGPAIISATGMKIWMKFNEFHRVDGPAVEFSNGNVEYYIFGEHVTKEEHAKLVS